ncbi:MAG: hypothetical protein IJF46_02090, partial [Bacteroidaceae bacterium]|nr:hypothetical protein [Bacteroidaceae bacterium]
NRPSSLPFISLHFRIGEAFIKSPHKSLNTSAAIIIFLHSLDFSRDNHYFCVAQIKKTATIMSNITVVA